MASGGRRPGSGRRPKSKKLKDLAGTTRKDRQDKAPTAGEPGSMICPLHLSDLAQLHFQNVATILEQQNRSSPHYAEHIALLALRLEQIQRFQAVLEDEGDTFTSESIKKVEGQTVVTRMVRARPEVTMLSDAMRHAQSLLGELMLNPAAAMRIAEGHKPQVGDFDDF